SEFAKRFSSLEFVGPDQIDWLVDLEDLLKNPGRKYLGKELDINKMFNMLSTLKAVNSYVTLRASIKRASLGEVISINELDRIVKGEQEDSIEAVANAFDELDAHIKRGKIRNKKTYDEFLNDLDIKRSDKAVIATKTPGGIDLNMADTGLNIQKDAQG